MTLKLDQIPAALHLPRPNWGVIRAWVERNVSVPDQPAAWADVAEDWLCILNKALGNRYRVYRSDRIRLLAPANYDQADVLLRYSESGIESIVDALGDLACEKWLGPLVILLFADNNTYGCFTSNSDSEIELIRSAGMCIRHGYVHIAIRPAPPDSLSRTILHELTHACLSHLNLPLWLEEGITQLAEETAIPEWGQFALTRESAAENRSYWRDHGLNEFWWGNGFSRFDEGQGYSYQLAQILFRLIMADHRNQLPHFVRHADADDAGDSAARIYLGKGLAEVATQFLGPGSWDPVPGDAVAYCRRGLMFLAQENYSQAIADFTTGIQLDPHFSPNFANRGLAYNQLGEFEAAIADYEHASKLDASDFYSIGNLAWIFATCRDQHFRNGDLALELANRACELSGFVVWMNLDALAASHAECGSFEEAVKWAKEATRLAPKSEKERCKARLRMYKEGTPYREYDILPVLWFTGNRPSQPDD
jgi:tetratricopeptide (TPR) repeat protein